MALIQAAAPRSGPEKLFDLGFGVYAKIKGAVDRSRPGVDPLTPWPALMGDQKRELGQAVAMLREAADQRHKEAQAHCGDIYRFGWGVAQDDRLAFVYNEKAAQQGHSGRSNNTGCYYRDGLGCEQSYVRSAEGFEKAARQGYTEAMLSFGSLYGNGQGVPQNYAQAAEWYEKAARQGSAAAQV